MKKIEELLESLSYKPKNIMLFKEAFTHSSAGAGYSYERLEFLGDAVLQLVSSQKLFFKYKDAKEGMLSKLRSAHVSETPLCSWARSVNLGSYIAFGKSELNNGGIDKDSILADVVEALIGAIYLDSGIEAAIALIDGIFEFEDNTGLLKDYKTEYQEIIQAKGEHSIEYITTDKKGPDHNPLFYVSLFLDGKKVSEGKGKSKKLAEQDAAKAAVLNGF